MEEKGGCTQPLLTDKVQCFQTTFPVVTIKINPKDETFTNLVNVGRFSISDAGKWNITVYLYI